MSSVGPIPRVKRTIDLFFVLFALLVTMPFILLTLVLIAVTNTFRGYPFHPLFYHERRYSNGKPFTLYKFNIFKYEKILEARARDGCVETKYFEHNDGVTWIGWLLKQIYIDELPQLYNVLRGEMSLIGPRPVNKQVFEKLMKAGIDDKSKVRAGITGNYQSYKRVAGKKADELDREYAEYYLYKPWHKLLWLDIKIILRTIKMLAKAEGE